MKRLAFLAVLAAVWLLMAKLPTSFLPDEDQGFLYVNVNLPAGAADARLQEIARMLGGHAQSKASLNHAREMLAQAQSGQSGQSG